jgi:hypothetical protein
LNKDEATPAVFTASFATSFIISVGAASGSRSRPLEGLKQKRVFKLLWLVSESLVSCTTALTGVVLLLLC